MYRVVIIEDDPMVASINKQYVEASPSFCVGKMFKSGKEALEYLKENTADLIILDYYTPLMNGDEFIDALHGMGKAPAIIMVTSASDADIVKRLLSRGVIDYLVKPFEYFRLKKALDKFENFRRYLDNSREDLSQEAIDRLLNRSEQNASHSSGPLAKGLNEATLKLIRDFLGENREGLFTSEQIAGHLGLSRITIRRYMNYMVDTGEITSVIDYRTGGRPSIKYGIDGNKK